MKQIKSYLVSACPAVIVFTFLLLSCSKKESTPRPGTDPLPDTLTTGWSKMTFPSQEELLDIYFYNNSTGFTVSRSGIYKSSDGGTSWLKAYTSPEGFVNIGMSNSNNAFFVRPGKIVMTRNGGASFDSTSLIDPVLADVFCINNLVTYAAGQFFWKTTDGGTTWTKLSDFNQRCSALYFSSELNGWAAGEFGLKKTTDGGVTWQPIGTGASFSSLLSVFFTGGSNGYISSILNIGRTTDGGASWSPVYSGQSSYYHDIHFTDASTGYITDGRFILKSTDGGATWVKVVRLGQDNFIELHFTDPGHGWAATINGVVIRFQ